MPVKKKITSKKLTMIEKLRIKFLEWRASPIAFIKDMWQLTPQPLKPEYVTAFNILKDQNNLQDVDPSWFEPFKRGLHITWQQYLILLTVEKSISNEASKRISVASAHGIGKTCTMSWIVIWYMICFKGAQIACTAPTSRQMFDVLWKELAVWITRMPQTFQSKLDRQSTYLRHTENPEFWFASAKTSKENSTEALAGVHGQHVMVLADEASGVPNESFDTMEGSLTEKDILVLLISNPTRLSGYFYDTHNNKDIKRKWQQLQFSNIDSPIVRDDYNQDIIDKHGEDSDEYRIRVLGQFPNEEDVDAKGYTRLMKKDQIKQIDKPSPFAWIGEPIMGIDPAGEGNDETRWVIRDQFKAISVASEKTSTSIGIARRTRTLMSLHRVKPENVWVDSFGVGAEAAVEIAKGDMNINPINVGDACLHDDDKNLFINRKAQNFLRLRKWLKSGLELVRDPAWSDEITSIRFRRNERGKIQIMSKREMKKDGYGSPNLADALMLTFSEEYDKPPVRTVTKGERQAQQSPTILKPTTKRNLHSVF